MDKAYNVLIGTGIAAITGAMDNTIVNTTLAAIQHDINASVNELMWVMAGFGLLFATMMITMGRLGDLRGRRKLLYVSIIGFALSSLGAGLATSPLFLIAMRVVQGLFAAGLFPCGMALTAEAFPDHLRSRALGIFGSIFGIGLAIGPVLGGIIVALLSWRWIFLINIPILLVSLVICVLYVDESKQADAEVINWSGVITLTLFLASLVFTISQGGYYGWQSHIIIASFLVAVITAILFVMIQCCVKVPLIPIKLFMNSGFLLGALVYFDGISLSWPIMFMMPLYLHIVVGLTTGVVGLVIFSLTIMTVITPVIAGHYYAKSAKAPSIILYIAFLCSIVSLLLFTQFHYLGPMWLIILAFILFGSAWGIANGIGVPLALSKLPNTANSGLISGALATLMIVVAVTVLTADVTLFDYFRQQHHFLPALHIACKALLAVSVVFCLLAIIIQFVSCQVSRLTSQ